MITGDSGGSSLHTSTAAPATWPESSAASRSASLTMPPRAQLTTRTPGFIAASSRAPIMFSVSSVSGTWTVRMSERLSTVCRSVRRTPRSRARLSGMNGSYTSTSMSKARRRAATREPTLPSPSTPAVLRNSSEP